LNCVWTKQHVYYAALDGNVEKLAKIVKDCDVIKTTHFDGDKYQSDICTASSAGDESVGVKEDELPTVTIIVVKGMYCIIMDS
jgi:hypothetical protein